GAAMKGLRLDRVGGRQGEPDGRSDHQTPDDVPSLPSMPAPLRCFCGMIHACVHEKSSACADRLWGRAHNVKRGVKDQRLVRGMSLPTGSGDQRVRSWGLTRSRMSKDRAEMHEAAKKRMGGTSLIGGLHIRRHE